MSTNSVHEEIPAQPPSPESGSASLAVTPYYTIIILSSIVVVFLSQQLISIDSVLYLAGLDKPLFAKGEYWRVFTHMVVHGGIFHIGFNGYALFILGRLVESISAKENVPVVFLLSAVCGGLMSCAFLPIGVSVGASGGVIGILGFLTIYSYRRRQLLSNAMFKNMIFNIVFIAFIGIFVLERIDNFAHLGGLLAGGLFGMFQIPDDLREDPRIAGKLLEKAGIASLGLIMLICLVTAAMFVTWYFVTGDLFPHFEFE